MLKCANFLLSLLFLVLFWPLMLANIALCVSLQDNSSAIVDHIFSSNAVVYPAIPVFHLRDLIKR